MTPTPGPPACWLQAQTWHWCLQRLDGRTLMRPMWRGLCGVPVMVVVLLLLSAQPAQATDRSTTFSLASPDKTIQVRFQLGGGEATYRVAHNGRPLLGRSSLGLQFDGMPALDGDFVVR